MKVIRDGIFLCSDCAMVACNGTRGTDISPTSVLMARIERGLATLGPHLVQVDCEEEYSREA